MNDPMRGHWSETVRYEELARLVRAVLCDQQALEGNERMRATMRLEREIPRLFKRRAQV